MINLVCFQCGETVEMEEGSQPYVTCEDHSVRGKGEKDKS